MGAALDPYLSPRARDEAFDAAAHEVGGERVSYGESVEGRPLTAWVVPRAGAPRVGVCAGIHGLEYIGVRCALEVLRSAAASALVDIAELWVFPCLNPDGYARTWETGGDAPVRVLRQNARGVDLNRNFPLPWGAVPSPVPTSGSDRPGDATYRGPHPLSEPESHHLATRLERLELHACVNFHSFMGTFIPARCPHRADRLAYARLCGPARAAQTHSRYHRLASPIDVFTGELEDLQHHVHRTWAVCLESFTLAGSLIQHLRAPTSFWRFNPREPEPWARSDAAAALAFLTAALTTERPPARRGAPPSHLQSWR